jgi:multicomponent Na+:H+ antiporter subunit B
VTSLILTTAARSLLPLLLLFSVFLLLRGHNYPGGGFIGGLVAAAAYSLYALAYGAIATRNALRLNPLAILKVGLLIAVCSGVISLFFGLPYMTGMWTPGSLPVVGKVGTPLLFDVGVYLAVLGVMLTIVLSLLEE